MKPLGEILQEASLVSATQIEEALREQSSPKKARIGEILADHGWIKQETADFFAQYWRSIVNQKGKKPLGYYLIAAGLLNEEQISTILGEQKQRKLWIRLGASAVIKGWIKQSTVDFFVEHLFPEYLEDSPFVRPKKLRNYKKSKGFI